MDEKDIQVLLKDAGYYAGEIDGILGPRSKKAAEKVLKARETTLPKGWGQWSWERKLVASGQMVLKFAGVDDVGEIDGYVGPSTRYAMEIYSAEKNDGKRPEPWRDDDLPQEDVGDTLAPSQDWPHQTNLRSFYGDAGADRCTAGKVELPFEMKIAWNPRQKIKRFSCHELVADSATRAFRKIASVYSPEQIEECGFDLFGGCYNYRRMRGGNALSTHSWGVAIDIDPERNQLRWGRDRARLARDDCDEFWRIWESEGWVSLGRARNYDWMHVQASKL